MCAISCNKKKYDYTLTQRNSPLLLSCSWQRNPRCSRMVPSNWSWTFRSVEITNILGGRRFRLNSWAPDIFLLFYAWLSHREPKNIIFPPNKDTHTCLKDEVCRYTWGANRWRRLCFSLQSSVRPKFVQIHKLRFCQTVGSVTTHIYLKYKMKAFIQHLPSSLTWNADMYGLI